jgi:hypothetical protein
MAISDLRVALPGNRELTEDLRPRSEGDRLRLAGGVGEVFADIEWAPRTRSGRFSTVIWAPGNHELWTHQEDPVKARGMEGRS